MTVAEPKGGRRIGEGETMSENKATIIRKTFTLTERDIQIIRDAIKKCGFVSDSETLRHIIRYFAGHAPCLKT